MDRTTAKAAASEGSSIAIDDGLRVPAATGAAAANETETETEAQSKHLRPKHAAHSAKPHKHRQKTGAPDAALGAGEVGNATASTIGNDDDDGYDFDALLAASSVVEDRWAPQDSWSIAPSKAVALGEAGEPLLVSHECVLGLADFFQHPHRGRNATELLAVATESSSHLSGIFSLNAQPWVYAGGGLGNVDECLSLNRRIGVGSDSGVGGGVDSDGSGGDALVHVCLAGGTSRDSLTFASACVVSACSARDVLADDFPERVATAGFRPGESKAGIGKEHDYGYDDDDDDAAFRELLHEYVSLHRRIATVGEYLGTGWVCGEYAVDWEVLPSLVWCGAMGLCLLLTAMGTWCGFGPGRWTGKKAFGRDIEEEQQSRSRCGENDDETSEGSSSSSSLSSSPGMSSSSSDCSSVGDVYRNRESQSQRRRDTFWSAWDARAHLGRLSRRPNTATACLDGLRVGSILWVIGAHVMAIQSSTGGGYLNPGNFLPPRGFTTTLPGQLLFSSRYAVDTFLCISGYLAAYVLQRKLPAPTNGSPGGRTRTALKVFAAIFFRILRILPLYVCCLGFWMFLAPHLGHGPFWYQWEHFLEPCRQLWWTNLLFVNNFWPWGATTEANCFYHSWYLAVDVQLFCLFAPWLVLLFRRSVRAARLATVALWVFSVAGTAVLAYTQGWSVNSFDGISVALFDVEGYAKPHVRAQSYLAGILVAFWPRRKTVGSSGSALMLLVLAGLFVLCFVTVTGAYARRACTFGESPLEGDDCGSLWSPAANFVYTAFGRAGWSVCIALLLHLCLGSDSTDGSSGSGSADSPPEANADCGSRCESHRPSLTGLVGGVLSWGLWTPLAHLSFGAYLIHPIVIYVWYLGGREKISFRISTYLMEFCSITVVTFCLSLLVTVLVEFPFGVLLRPPAPRKRKPPELGTPRIHGNDGDTELRSLLGVDTSSPSVFATPTQSYGSVPR